MIYEYGAWCSYIDKRELKNSEKNPSHCHFVHHQSTWAHPGMNLVRFYGMLKISAECDRDTASVKFKDISHELPALLLGVSAATRELWWMNQK
jgi:hypothetical protein